MMGRFAHYTDAAKEKVILLLNTNQQLLISVRIQLRLNYTGMTQRIMPKYYVCSHSIFSIISSFIMSSIR